ncbi:MAG TPA: ParA family protein [Thermoanaerobaculia bacterium]|nr:ParA family protein [Thermoanaerobaculia bacterium]
MRAKVICMASAKGGAGKTILTATFGTFLAAIDKKVLLIDTDAATNGLTLLYLKEVLLQAEYAIADGRRPSGVYEYVPEEKIPEVVTLQNGMHLIPASYKFGNTEHTPMDAYSRSLMSIVRMFRESYDFIFLDAQAGSDLYAYEAMRRSISDEVVIVSEYDPMSAAGIERIKGLFREDLTYVRTWVLLNKMLPDFVKSFSDFLEIAKYLSPIPWDAEVVRAYARRKLALDLDSGNEHTLAVLQSLKMLLDDQSREDLEAWEAKKIVTIRQPIEQQYKDVEIALTGLIFARHKLTEKRRRNNLFRMAYGAGGASALLAGFLAFGWLPSIERALESNSLQFLLVLLATLLAVTLGYFTAEVFPGRSSAEIDIEESRLIRQEASLEDRLKRLEALKDADLEILLKARGDYLR